MGIFIAMYIIIVVIYIISLFIDNSNRQKNFICISCFILLWLILALRDVSIGVDLKQGYIPIWELFSGDLSDLFQFNYRGREKGWQLYNHIIKLIIGDRFNLFLAITAFLTLLPIFQLIRKYSSNPTLSVIIYASFLLYHFSFSGLRQALAISITTISYKYIVEKKIVPFVLYIGIASLIHKSASIFLIAYPLCNLNLKKTFYVTFVIAWGGGLFFLKNIVSSIIPLLFHDTSYQQYIISEGGSYMLMILYFLFFLLTFLIKKEDENTNRWRVMLFLMVVCQSLGLVTYAAARIGYYFLPFFALALPNLTVIFKQRRLMDVLITAFMVFFFFFNNANGYLNVIPYKFFWQP